MNQQHCLKIAVDYSKMGRSALVTSPTTELVDLVEMFFQHPSVQPFCREAIVAYKCGLLYPASKHGPDAFFADGTPVEIKTESYMSDKPPKLSGRGVFGTISSLQHLESMTNHTMLAGFYNNRLVYIVGFESWLPGFRNRMAKRLCDCSVNTVLKFNNKDLACVPLTLWYYDNDHASLQINDMSEIMTDNLIAVLNRLSHE
jgi:hypothetical protein